MEEGKQKGTGANHRRTGPLLNRVQEVRSYVNFLLTRQPFAAGDSPVVKLAENGNHGVSRPRPWLPDPSVIDLDDENLERFGKDRSPDENVWNWDTSERPLEARNHRHRDSVYILEDCLSACVEEVEVLSVADDDGSGPHGSGVAAMLIFKTQSEEHRKQIVGTLAKLRPINPSPSLASSAHESPTLDPLSPILTGMRADSSMSNILIPVQCSSMWNEVVLRGQDGAERNESSGRTGQDQQMAQQQQQQIRVSKLMRRQHRELISLCKQIEMYGADLLTHVRGDPGAGGGVPGLKGHVRRLTLELEKAREEARETARAREEETGELRSQLDDVSRQLHVAIETSCGKEESRGSVRLLRELSGQREKVLEAQRQCHAATTSLAGLQEELKMIKSEYVSAQARLEGVLAELAFSSEEATEQAAIAKEALDEVAEERRRRGEAEQRLQESELQLSAALAQARRAQAQAQAGSASVRASPQAWPLPPRRGRAEEERDEEERERAAREDDDELPPPTTLLQDPDAEDQPDPEPQPESTPVDSVSPAESEA